MAPVTSIKQLEKRLEAQAQFADVTFEHFEWQEESADLTFSHCQFVNITFLGNQFDTCLFEDCKFESCAFDSAKLKCKFYNAELETGCSFKFTAFPGTSFRQSDLSLCNFSRSNLYRIEMEQCQGTGLDCSYSTVAQDIGSSVTLNSARLVDCNFSYADFTGAWLCEAQLPENRFNHAVFHNANLENAALNDCDLHGIEAKNIVISGADLRGAQISGLDIREIDMTGVRINDYQQQTLLQEIGVVVE